MATQAGKSDAINLHELLEAARRRLPLIAIILIAGSIVSALVMPNVIRQYKSVAVVFVKEPSNFLDASIIARSLAPTRSTLLKTVETSGVKNVDIEPTSALRVLPDGFEVRNEGQLLMFQVLAKDPADATRLANAWASTVVEQLNQQAGGVISRLKTRNDKLLLDIREDWKAKVEAAKRNGTIRVKEPAGSEEGSLDLATAELSGLAFNFREATKTAALLDAAALGDGTFGTVITPAVDARSPFSVNSPSRYFIAGVLASLCLGIGVALLRELAADVVRGARDLPPTVMKDVVPVVSPAAYDLLQQRPNEPAADALRRLALALSAAAGSAGGGRLVLAVTSASPGDGKTFVAANLASAFAQQGRSVLLIDAAADAALTSWLKPAGGKTLPAAMSAGSWSSADAASVPRGGYALLAADPASRGGDRNTDHLAGLLGKIRSEYQVIVIDCNAISSNSDALAFCRASDMALVVARSRRTRRVALERAQQLLQSVGVARLAVVVNAADAHDLRAEGLSN